MPLACRKLAVIALFSLAATAAGAAPVPIGEAKNIIPAASSQGEGGNNTLAPGSTVFQNDLVRTGAVGRAGLQFLDETQLDVGPNSSAKLDRFVFNPDRTAAQASINLAKGVFRFVSGSQTRPNTYSITTPHATLGIRGTEIEITVTDFQTNIVVKSGLVNACSRTSAGCRELSPTRQNNAGIFTATGLVRAYAFRESDSFPGGSRTGGLGGGGRGSSSPPPGEEGTLVRGASVGPAGGVQVPEPPILDLPSPGLGGPTFVPIQEASPILPAPR